MYVLVVKACVSPIRQSEKRMIKILFLKKQEKGAREQNILRSFKLYSKAYVLFVKSTSFFKTLYGFFLSFLRLTRKNNVSLI